MQRGHSYLFVRARLGDDIPQQEFDDWYSQEHLPRAVAALKALRGWRFWSDGEQPGKVHYAIYEFAAADVRDRVRDSPELRALVTEFSERWGNSVTRTRSFVTLSGDADYVSENHIESA